jgi:hypothetical protein
MRAKRCDSPRILDSNAQVYLCIAEDTHLDGLVDEILLPSTASLKVSPSLKFGIDSWGVRDLLHNGLHLAMIQKWISRTFYIVQ